MTTTVEAPVRDNRTPPNEAAHCQAKLHGSRRAYEDHHCRCPETIQYMHERWRRKRCTGRRNQGGPVGGRRPDVDRVAVQRALDGDRVMVATVLTVRELGVAIAQLARYYDPRAIAMRLGVSDRTVKRHRGGYVKATRDLFVKSGASRFVDMAIN